jgi:RNA-directed DNA polymerase
LSIASVSANVSCLDASYCPASAETWELKVENGVPLNGAPGTPAAAIERNRIHTANPVTRIVHLTEGGEGLDFLGFHHRWVRGRGASEHIAFLVRWPSRQAMQRARSRVRELTGRDQLRWPIEQIVGDLNRFLRSWAGYFRYGNSTVQFDQIIRHTDTRLALLIAKRHQQHRRYGWQAFAASPDRLGLISLNGIIVAPRPNRPWKRGR